MHTTTWHRYVCTPDPLRRPSFSILPKIVCENAFLLSSSQSLLVSKRLVHCSRSWWSTIRVMVLTNCVSCVHLSLVNEPWVTLSANCHVMLTCWIWIIGSKLMRSYSQSKSTRCVCDMWRNVILLSLYLFFNIVIFKDVLYRSHAEYSRLWTHAINVFKWIMMFWYWCLMNKLGITYSLKYTIPKTVSHNFNAGMSSMRNPASNDIISATVLPWETAVSCLQAHEIVTNVCDTNMHWTPPEIDFESVTFPEKIGVLEQSQVAIYCLILNVSIHSVVGCVINVTDETCCALGSILWQIWPNNSLSNVKKTGLPPLVKYKH